MLDQKQFFGVTMAEAQKAAESWWSDQKGLTRVSEYMSPANLSQERRLRWIAIIVYERPRAARR
jgi:hypothetical protein